MMPPLFLLAAISSLLFTVQAVTPANNDDNSLLKRDPGATQPWDNGLSPDAPSNPSTVTVYVTHVISSCTSTVAASDANNNQPTDANEDQPTDTDKTQPPPSQVESPAATSPSPSQSSPLSELWSRVPESATTQRQQPSGHYESGRPILPGKVIH
ncbi:hypothetical protein CPLU01_01591 [Colletotrichum plurivorum]|uniref:Uncharacterized protein n=1 Tax=Colletotrichum plurivorum TaxID=2175906 RepID=A0A8H6NN89_9PEZI|nr:hypothetical protein CPLU01_01591 [Colletotrichum plurivorum]